MADSVERIGTSGSARVIVHTIDGDGHRVALVPLGRTGEKGTAVILEDDLALLESLGLSMRWNRNRGTGVVVAPAGGSSGGCVQVSRMSPVSTHGTDLRL